jgi:hypothetical protein
MFQKNGIGRVQRVEYRVARVQWPRQPKVAAHLGVAVKAQAGSESIFGRLTRNRLQARLRTRNENQKHSNASVFEENMLQGIY